VNAYKISFFVIFALWRHTFTLKTYNLLDICQSNAIIDFTATVVAKEVIVVLVVEVEVSGNFIVSVEFAEDDAVVENVLEFCAALVLISAVTPVADIFSITEALPAYVVDVN
jgi:hypothetical protein